MAGPMGVPYKSLKWAAKATDEVEGGIGTGAATRGGILFIVM